MLKISNENRLIINPNNTKEMISKSNAFMILDSKKKIYIIR